ncbi:hypothetical protein WN55_11375 [Dufourea novaeangliae]|uniref:Uncharacterized protein n=2 Tax=Dufourea novaeangliae TaxID=178035 RepID=A0A154PAJ2_DUFNO|nr:hypothetical protein WN55_11375 [Dufourea novaeangliae]
MTDLTVCHGVNQLYLGVATSSKISIYTWLDEYFDEIQVIHRGTKKLIPFYSKGFIYLAATGPVTLIFKYSFKSNKFEITQRLPSSQDVSYFLVTEGHYTDHFLSISTESSVVVYKEIYDRFVPFQHIALGRTTMPIVSNKAVLLLSLHEDTVLSYQYDGWRFVQLNVKLFGVEQIRQVPLHGKELLLVKYKNDTWTLMEPVWNKQKSYKDLQEEIRTWNINAMKAARRTLENISDLKEPVRILRGHIDQLFVHNINEHNSQAMRDATKLYKKLITRLEEQKITMNSKLRSGNLTLTSLNATKIRVKCRTKCKVSRLNIEGNSDTSSKLRNTRPDTQVQSFRAVSVKEMNNWKCPVFSLPIETIIVDKSINGISLNHLQENTLKVVGNQEVTGKHTFFGVNVTEALLPLDIASNLTKQELETGEIKAKELNLTEGGFLLPSNGPPVTMTGSIKASKMRIKGDVSLGGRITGKSVKSLLPVMMISETMTLGGGSILENAKVENLRAQDLVTNKTGSVTEILTNAISLSENVPVSLVLSSEKMKWSNITLHGSQNWVTANSQNTVVISGKKQFLRNVEITKTSYENLKLPVIETPVCTATVMAPEIKTTVLTINNITVKDLNSSYVFGNLGERYYSQNLTFLFKPLDKSTETLYYNVTVKNATVTRMNNMNLTELKTLMDSWIQPNTLRGPIEVTNLTVDILRSPIQFRLELPKVIRNMISKQNTLVSSVNGIDLTDFLSNVIKLEDMISLGNITFGNGFTANHIYATHLPFNFSQLEENSNLQKKQISGNLKADTINLPYSFAFPESEDPFNIIVKDSATFLSEPNIQRMNNVELEELLGKIWLVGNSTVVQGRNLHIVNASMTGNVTLNTVSDILNLETWRNISKRVLSKTRSQEIPVLSTLNNVETPGIIGSNSSTVKSFASDFNDMFKNALVRDKKQEVKAKWTFNRLKILGEFRAKSNINNKNLKTDVMRLDSKEIVVAGKTTVIDLTAENLNGLNFDEYVSNSFRQEEKLITIKGRKSFNTVTINSINVSGNVMGQNLTEALSKSKDQIIRGQKTFQGSVNASTLVVDGLVNDVNLTNLINHQLKKQKPVQRIKTGIELQKSLTIVENLTINGSYGSTELKNFYKIYSNIAPLAEKTSNYSRASETINTALKNRAVYMNKLKIVEGMEAVNISNKNASLQREQCTSILCSHENVINDILKSNSSDFVFIKTIVLDEEEFIVRINLDYVAIFLYNTAEKRIQDLQGFHIPKIIEALVEPMSSSIWIALRLSSQTLVLHYHPWKDLQEYLLPATDVFIMSRSPNGQLLLLLSDGVWNLEGLASPENIIELPLEGQVETFITGFDYYVRCRSKNDTTLMKARYIGN